MHKIREIKAALLPFLLVTLLVLVVSSPGWAAYSVKQSWARFSATTGEAITAGHVVMLKDDGLAYKADANDAALRPAVGVAGKSAASGAKVEIIVFGIMTGWTTLTEGGPGYMSETAGGITQAAPAYSQQVGFAVSATDYLINCQNYFDSSSLTVLGTLSGASPLVLEGATADASETTVTVTDPTADRTVTLADGSGTVMLSALATNAVDAANAVTGASNGLVFEGATADAFETTITATDPTADRTVTLADGSGTVMLSSLATNAADAANAVTGTSNGLLFEGATADAFETTVTVTDPTADRTVTIPNRTGQVQIAGAAVVLTPGAAVTLTVGQSNVYTVTPTDNEDETITFSGAGTAGDEITLIVITVGTADEVITFHATLVSSTGTLTAGVTAARYYVIRFISDGSHWYEVSRTAVQT
jgi:hypothetical protein